MANVKISELIALSPPDAADIVPVTDSSASQTKRTTVGEIVGIINGDVDVASNGTATISELPVSKLQDGTARQLLQTDAAGTGVQWTSNVDVPGTLDVTGAAMLDSTLGVSGQSTLASAAVSDLTSGRVVLAGTSGELEDDAGLTFNGTQLDVDGDVVITGDLSIDTISAGIWQGTAIDAAYLDSTIVTTGDTGTVTSAMLASETIVNADISPNAEIAVSKLQDGTARQLLQTDAAGTGVEWTSSVYLTGTLNVGVSTSQFSSTGTINGDLEIRGSTPQLRFYESDNTDQNPWVRVVNGSLIFEHRTDSGVLQTGLATLSPTGLGIGITPSSLLHLADGGNIAVGTTTGTKIGTATTQKLGFFNATPVVRPTTGVPEAAFVENSGGTAVNVDSTFGGYTIQQVVQALQTLGLLA